MHAGLVPPLLPQGHRPPGISCEPGASRNEGALQDGAASPAAPPACPHSPAPAAPRPRTARAEHSRGRGRRAAAPGTQARPRAPHRCPPAARGPYRLFHAETRSSASCCSRLSPQYSPTITWSHSARPLHATTVRSGFSRLRAGDELGWPRRLAGPARAAMPPAPLLAPPPRPALPGPARPCPRRFRFPRPPWVRLLETSRAPRMPQGCGGAGCASSAAPRARGQGVLPLCLRGAEGWRGVS